MKDIFQEFFNEQTGSKSYTASKYNLKESYADCVLVEASAGGSSGGDCYGGYTTRYDKNDSDIESDISDEITYKFRDLFHQLGLSDEQLRKAAEEKASNLVSSYSHIADTDEGSGDYYGNYTSYRLFEVNVISFLEDLVDENTLHELQEFASDYVNDEDKKLHAQQLKLEENNLLLQLDNFDKKSQENKEKLKTDLSNYKKKITLTEKQLAGFDLQMTKDKKDLQKKLADVQALVNPHKDNNIQTNKPSKTKKKM